MFLGWKRATEEEMQEVRDARMRSEYYDPIERFPERIDQLLDALNRVCLIRVLMLYMFMIVVDW